MDMPILPTMTTEKERETILPVPLKQDDFATAIPTRLSNYKNKFKEPLHEYFSPMRTQ